jgi:hypothetical protein
MSSCPSRVECIVRTVALFPQRGKAGRGDGFWHVIRKSADALPKVVRFPDGAPPSFVLPLPWKRRVDELRARDEECTALSFLVRSPTPCAADECREAVSIISSASRSARLVLRSEHQPLIAGIGLDKMTARRRESSELVPVGAAFSVPFWPVKKGPPDRMTGERMVLNKLLLSNRPRRRVTRVSCTAIPDQIREDDTLPRTGRWLWPMRLATSTTGQASHQPATKWDKKKPVPRPFRPFGFPTSCADLFPGLSRCGVSDGSAPQRRASRPATQTQ